MKLVPIPVEMLPVGEPLPVDLWNPDGVLLLRKGQPIDTAEDREKLKPHNPSAAAYDALAWQRSYERMVHNLLLEGVDVDEVSRRSMPGTIRERDYEEADPLNGGWLDLQAMLRGILYQGGLALNPLPRLLAVEAKVGELLRADADEALFVLFQALADGQLGYSATHAMLSATIADLAGQKLGLDEPRRASLRKAALTMNIGMAREQDLLARQKEAPSTGQRELIHRHPEHSAAILSQFGIDDEVALDLVRWHHVPDEPEALRGNLLARRLLTMTDIFIAKMSARRTRDALSPLESAKAIYLLAGQDTQPSIGAALTSAVGFYPPGTYVKLSSGEIAVSVQRGARANAPWVMVIIGRDGMPTVTYRCLDTSDPQRTVVGPQRMRHGQFNIQLDRVRRARERIPV